MNFSLDPSSGFADSYLDVEFSVQTQDYPKTVIRIYNETSNEQLQILGTSFGYILNGDQLVLKKKNSTTGHINIFNYDKMNKKFLAHRSVSLRCVAEFYDENDQKLTEEEDRVIFYNEMHSLDAEIIPFDLIIHNRTINTNENEPLRIDIVSDLSKKYELCISSLDNRLRCHFEVAAKQGKTSIQIPCEFLYYDLELRNNKNKKFKFQYIKHQGTTMSRIANKRYMPIQDSEISFVSDGGITPLPQRRQDPIGRLLSKEFVVSDRYLVICPRKHSGFARKSEFGPEKLMDLTMMINEGQHMMSLSKKLKQFEADDSSENIKNTARSLQLAKQSQQKTRRPQISASQVQLMRNVSRAYDTISSKTRSRAVPQPKQVQTFSASRAVTQGGSGGGCAPCSRKRKQNA